MREYLNSNDQNLIKYSIYSLRKYLTNEIEKIEIIGLDLFNKNILELMMKILSYTNDLSIIVRNKLKISMRFMEY